MDDRENRKHTGSKSRGKGAPVCITFSRKMVSYFGKKGLNTRFSNLLWSCSDTFLIVFHPTLVIIFDELEIVEITNLKI